MGTTFSTIQIRNHSKFAPEMFKESLCGYFKKRGLILTTEDDFQFSYRLAFSDKSDWVTLSLPEYEPGATCVNADAAGIAKALKTHCIATSVIDSDVLCLDLFCSTGIHSDSINIGRLDYGIPEAKGNQKLWETFLSEGTTWERFIEVCNDNYTFLEEALAAISPFMSMDEKNVTRDYHDWDQTGEDKTCVIDLYLKKSQPSGKKAISLNSAFKQIFGEALAPLGFVKLKGKYPYFVRLIGDEILHVITFRNEWSSHPDYKEFNVLGGVATVYRPSIDLAVNPSDNINWLNAICEFYSKSNPLEFDLEFRSSIYSFTYKADDGESILNEVKRSFEMTKSFMLPVLNGVVDLKSSMDYFDRFNSTLLGISYNANSLPVWRYGGDHHSEHLLLIKSYDRDEYVERIKRAIAFVTYLAKEEPPKHYDSDQLRNWEETQEDNRQRTVLYKEKLTLLLDILHDTPDQFYAEASAELERRKAVNIETLKSYGLINNF